MDFELKVTGTAVKGNEHFFVVETNNQTNKWYKCTDRVHSYLSHVKPCLVSIDEQIEDVVSKVNWIKSLKKSQSSKVNTGNGSVTAFIHNKEQQNAGQSSTPNNTLLDSPLMLDFLSLAEESILNYINFWEKRRDSKDKKAALDSLEHKKRELYKLMDKIGQNDKQ